ncbi:MAG TPA: hypothetical protein PK453_27915 [Leptospiraceae bacterium]|nr:hypothetical protein [Leptospiraceae bacterium]HNF17517.1 hypothetical protein [Leptospiraceae bacterium]HNF23571.1 hypothetical protein [Leptospiraceae bacterium]HNI96771.1 hypothetical protein [Leptospiraceae bacterium]HNM04351.1 hypothetical protein [Leptospiraceae bacterium]
MQGEFEAWLYLLKKAEKLKGGEMKTLEKKKPKIGKAISEGLALMPSVKKHKDLDFLKELLEISLKCSDLNEMKKLLKK